MVNYQYRIVEFDGLFMIQAGREITKGVLWWRHKEIEWCRTDILGHPLLYAPRIGINTAVQIGIQPKFTTLYAAQAKIRSWQQGQIIHKAELN